MTKALITVAAIACCATAIFAAIGVDVAEYYSVDDWKCVIDNGRRFAIVRAWCSFGGFDDNAPPTVANAWAAGMDDVDVYLFPCAGKYAAPQVDGLLDTLHAKSVKFGMVWFDIEENPSPNCGWNTNLNDNCLFMKELIEAMRARGQAFGIYTSHWEWERVMGLDCHVGAPYQLWDAHWDNEPTGNFIPYAGWTHASMKQYSGTGHLCGREVDFDGY